MNKAPVFLLVEPSSILRPVLSRWLEDVLTSSRILIATNAEDALKLTADEKPAYVLVAINLPDRKGLELLRQLRQTLPKAKIVATSWFEIRGLLNRVLSAGADEFLLKDELRSKLFPVWGISIE
jgi:two-component system, NarL family, response regulator DevR